MPRLRLLECRVCIAFQAVTPVPATFVYSSFSLEGRTVERLTLCEQHHGTPFDQILFALGWNDLASEVVDLNVVGAAPAPADLQGPARAPVAELSPAPQQEALLPEPRREQTPAKESEKKVKKPPNRGGWLEDEDQVACPLKHRAGLPKKYWVRVADRGDHANRHNLRAADIDWVLQPGLVWSAWCTSHEICMRTPGGDGFPFVTTHQLQSHQGKTQHWAPAGAPDDPPVPAAE